MRIGGQAPHLKGPPDDRDGHEPAAPAHDEDMTRHFVRQTRNDYIRHVTFAAFLGRSPDWQRLRIFASSRYTRPRPASVHRPSTVRLPHCASGSIRPVRAGVVDAGATAGGHRQGEGRGRVIAAELRQLAGRRRRCWSFGLLVARRKRLRPSWGSPGRQCFGW